VKDEGSAFRLFDDLIVAVPAYLNTIYSVFFCPRRVINTSRGPLICSPGTTLFFTVILLWFIVSCLSGKMMLRETGFVPSAGLPFILVVYIELACLLQSLLIRPLVPKAITPLTAGVAPAERSHWRTDYEAFIYATSAGTIVAGVPFFLALTHLQHIWSLALFGLAVLTWFWPMVRIVRTRYAFGAVKTLVVVLIAHLATMVVGTIFVALLFRGGFKFQVQHIPSGRVLLAFGIRETFSVCH